MKNKFTRREDLPELEDSWVVHVSESEPCTDSEMGFDQHDDINEFKPMLCHTCGKLAHTHIIGSEVTVSFCNDCLSLGTDLPKGMQVEYGCIDKVRFLNESNSTEQANVNFVYASPSAVGEDDVSTTYDDQAFQLDFLRGNILKYVIRSKDKPAGESRTDLEKALWHLQKLIEQE